MLRRSFGDWAALLLGALALLVVAAPRAVGAPGLLPVALVSVPLVLADVRGRRLPNTLTLSLLGIGAVLAPTGGTLAAVLATVAALGALHAAGGLGLGDVKLAAALAPPLAELGPERVALAPALAFVLAGVWALIAHGRRGRLAFGPFQLAAFWLVL
ncbi:leader peptidase (prepilin peptidase)/N-methyltransferase [Rathayibacter agropyri]